MNINQIVNSYGKLEHLSNVINNSLKPIMNTRLKECGIHNFTLKRVSGVLSEKEYEDFKSDTTLFFCLGSRKSRIAPSGVINVMDYYKLLAMRNTSYGKSLYEVMFAKGRKDKKPIIMRDDDFDYFSLRVYKSLPGDTIKSFSFDFSEIKHINCNNKVVVAEVDTEKKDVINLLVDVFAIMLILPEEGNKIFTSIIDWYLKEILGSTLTDDDIEKDIRNVITERVNINTDDEHGYKAEIKELEKLLKQQRNESVKANSRISELQKTIENAKQEISYYESQLAKLNRIIKDNEAKYVKAVDNLSKLGVSENAKRIINDIYSYNGQNKIESINIINNNLMLYTNMIYIKNGKYRHRIGKFEITIPLFLSSYGNGDISFKNITPGCKRHSHWSDDCHHPHIDSYGRACFGAVWVSIEDALNRREFGVVVELLICFLEQANTTDPAGRNISSWDIVDEEGNILYTGYYYSNPPKELVPVICEACGKEGFESDPNFVRTTISNTEVTICSECLEKNPKICAKCTTFMFEETDDIVHCTSCGKDFHYLCTQKNRHGERVKALKNMCGDCSEKHLERERLSEKKELVELLYSRIRQLLDIEPTSNISGNLPITDWVTTITTSKNETEAIKEILREKVEIVIKALSSMGIAITKITPDITKQVLDKILPMNIVISKFEQSLTQKNHGEYEICLVPTFLVVTPISEEVTRVDEVWTMLLHIYSVLDIAETRETPIENIISRETKVMSKRCLLSDLSLCVDGSYKTFSPFDMLKNRGRFNEKFEYLDEFGIERLVKNTFYGLSKAMYKEYSGYLEYDEVTRDDNDLEVKFLNLSQQDSTVSAYLMGDCYTKHNCSICSDRIRNFYTYDKYLGKDKICNKCFREV